MIKYKLFTEKNQLINYQNYYNDDFVAGSLIYVPILDLNCVVLDKTYDFTEDGEISYIDLILDYNFPEEKKVEEIKEEPKSFFSKLLLKITNLF